MTQANYTLSEVQSLRAAVISELIAEGRVKSGNDSFGEGHLSPVQIEERVRTYIVAGLKAGGASA